MGFHFFRYKKFTKNQYKTHKILKEFRKILNEYDNRMSVGEVFALPPGDPSLSARFLGDGDELHLAFDFSLMYRWWNARRFYKTIKKWLNSISKKGWPCHVLSNHDQPRSISRYGGGADMGKRAKVAAALLLTIPGTPFIYYGEEIGMKNSKIGRKDIHDPLGKRFWPIFSGRDPMRTPMQWSSGKNAGFTKGKEWLPVSSDFKEINVKTQKKDSNSIYNFYRDLIHIRKESVVLQKGYWKPVLKGHGGILGFYRMFEDEKIFVVLNFTNKIKKVKIHDQNRWKILFQHTNLKMKT